MSNANAAALSDRVITVYHVGPGGVGRCLKVKLVVRGTNTRKALELRAFRENDLPCDLGVISEEQEHILYAKSTTRSKQGFLVTLVVRPGPGGLLWGRLQEERFSEHGPEKAKTLREWGGHAIFIRHGVRKGGYPAGDFVNIRQGDDRAVKRLLTKFAERNERRPPAVSDHSRVIRFRPLYFELRRLHYERN